MGKLTTDERKHALRLHKRLRTGKADLGVVIEQIKYKTGDAAEAARLAEMLPKIARATDEIGWIAFWETGAMPPSPPPAPALGALAGLLLESALKEAGGDERRAASLVGMSPAAFRAQARAAGISAPRPARARKPATRRR